MIAGLGARVHLFVRPVYRKNFLEIFRDVLLCDVRELDFGLPHPIALVSFPDGSSFSAEFSAEATAEAREPANYTHALRGAWIEFRAADAEGVRRKLRDGGVASFSHPASPHAYFSAPGGQVFRVLDLDYTGP